MTQEVRRSVDTKNASTWPMVARDAEFRQALAALDAGAQVRGVALVGESGFLLLHTHPHPCDTAPCLPVANPRLHQLSQQIDLKDLQHVV
jgi:hypothetical protein